MSNKQHLSAWVSRETKGQFAEIARLQGKSESALLKSMVEAMLVTATPPPDPTPVPESAPSSRLSVRLRDDDLLMLRGRAQARGMPAATYVSFLLRSHLRHLAPLPDAELQAFKSAIGEVKAIGRNLNQIARATYAGRVTGGAAVDDLRALLTACTKLWESMKRVVSVNLESWESGNDQTRR
jgi:hypothetical protein